VSTSDAPALATEFDARRAYRLHPDLALRPERFGALLYHYGNRRLTFLKSPQLAALVADLDAHPSVDDALAAHRISEASRPAVLRALARLQASEVISVR
jgi:putative mycofactocin binding protein MftB